jgi:hypothetical protein
MILYGLYASINDEMNTIRYAVSEIVRFLNGEYNLTGSTDNIARIYFIENNLSLGEIADYTKSLHTKYEPLYSS